MIHFCTVCSDDSSVHAAECENECRHFPPLCCPGCECRSFEEAHEEDEEPEMPNSVTSEESPSEGQARSDRHAADLLNRGYHEVTEAGALTVGDRVRHSGERYAANTGTAHIERIFIRHGNDIEIIAKRDKPGFGPSDTHGFWASYHTVKIST